MDFNAFLIDLDKLLYSEELILSDEMINEFYKIVGKQFKSPIELKKALEDELVTYKRMSANRA